MRASAARWDANDRLSPPSALPEWAWPRRAPRTLLGLSILSRWLQPLRDTLERSIAGEASVSPLRRFTPTG